MEPISFDKTCYWVDGRPTYLNSGEFHYFRVPKPDWRRRMELFKKAGGNCLATYIPWLIHEPGEGTFVFDAGDGITDLEAFLRVAADVGLYVTARPGPYQYSELIYGGLPEWLFKRYPEVLARTPEGDPFGLPSVSYLHPVFLEKVVAWFDAVCPILARHTLSKGGPIAFTQLDNELMGIHIWFGGLDYNHESMGIGVPGGRYPRFLKARYEGIAKLNTAYGTHYAAFDEVRPIPTDDVLTGSRSAILWRRDYFDFYRDATTAYALTLRDLLRERGIDTPFIHNSANPSMNAYFVEMAGALSDNFLLGSDHYYNLSQSWPQNNPTPQYARNVFLSNEELRLLGYPPTVLELPSGSASDWPPITAHDAKACYMTNLAYGMKGHNYYVFTGGPNPPGVGETTDLYDYGAPIGPSGQVRPLYTAQAEFARFIADHAWLTQAGRAHDCRIGISFGYARAERYWRERGDFLFSASDAWHFLDEGLLTTAFCAGLSPNCVNLDADEWVADVETPLLVAASDCMARAQQERIVHFLENGGRALITPLLPRFDDDLAPCTVLADFIGAPTWRRSAQTVIRVLVEGPHQTVSNVLKNEVFFADTLPDEAEVCGIDERTGSPLAWQVSTPGGGTVIVLGLAWDHRKNEQAEMLLAIADRLGLQRRVICSNPNIWTSLRFYGSQGVLFLINLFSTPMEAEISYRTMAGGHVDLGEHHVGAISVLALEVTA